MKVMHFKVLPGGMISRRRLWTRLETSLFDRSSGVLVLQVLSARGLLLAASNIWARPLQLPPDKDNAADWQYGGPVSVLNINFLLAYCKKLKKTNHVKIWLSWALFLSEKITALHSMTFQQSSGIRETRSRPGRRARERLPWTTFGSSFIIFIKNIIKKNFPPQFCESRCATWPPSFSDAAAKWSGALCGINCTASQTSQAQDMITKAANVHFLKSSSSYTCGNDIVCQISWLW